MAATTMNAGSVAARVRERLPNLPAGAGEVGSGVILDHMAEDIVNDVVNWTQDNALNSDSIAPKYQNIVINATTSYALAAKSSLGVGFNATVGEFSVDRGDTSPEARVAQFYADQANRSLKMIGRSVAWKAGFY